MTRPITIEQPARSLLRACVDRLAGITPTPDDLKHPDAGIRALSALRVLEREPRLWLLPLAFVRDVLVIPALTEEHGEAAVEALYPGIADHIACAQQALAKASATAEQRRAPDNPRRNEALVVAIIVAAWVDIRRPWLSDSAAYAATSEALGPGINAKVIRDTISRHCRRLGRVDGETAKASMLGIIAVRRLLPDVVFKLPARYSLERYKGARKSGLHGERTVSCVSSPPPK